MSHLRARAATATLSALALQVGPGLLGPGWAGAATAAADDVTVPDNLTPITGGPKGSSAVPVTAGRFADTTAATIEESRVYAYTRTIPDSVLMVGATVLGGDVARRARLNVIIGARDAAGNVTRCDRAPDRNDNRAQAMPLVTRATYTVDNRADCGTRSDLVIAVFSNDGVPPGTPYELDVWEVPPVTNRDALPQIPGGASAETFEATTPTTAVAPGASKSTASILEPDESVHVDLPLGRISWFAVPLAYNELLDALATVSDPEGIAGGSRVEVQVVSPVGGVAGVEQLQDDTYRETATVGADPVTVESGTFLVSPGQRLAGGQAGTSLGQATLSSEPGYYYVAVWADGTPDEGTLSMTLTPGVLPATGLDENGVDPEYAAPQTDFPAPDGARPEPYDADAASPAGAGDASASAGGSAGGDEASGDGTGAGDGAGDEAGADASDGPDGLVVGGLIGLAVVLAGVGTALVVRARRAQPNSR